MGWIAQYGGPSWKWSVAVLPPHSGLSNGQSFRWCIWSPTLCEKKVVWKEKAWEVRNKEVWGRDLWMNWGSRNFDSRVNNHQRTSTMEKALPAKCTWWLVKLTPSNLGHWPPQGWHNVNTNGIAVVARYVPKIKGSCSGRQIQLLQMPNVQPKETTVSPQSSHCSRSSANYLVVSCLY